MNYELENLFEELSICQKCTSLQRKNGRDCSLINFYKKKELAKKIPSIWTDWASRLDSNIMIIGQDWGPYQDMEKLYQSYKKEETMKNWKCLIESEKSTTKKMLAKYLKTSAIEENFPLKDNFLEDIYITNAILCARRGNEYRGDNIDLKTSTKNCSLYLKRQIEIVKPKVIVTLGYYPLYSLSLAYSFLVEKTLTSTLEKTKEILLENFIIIPLYHPTAQISKEKQISQYRRIWNYMKGNDYELKK